jgi:hypothetical protein
MMSKAREMFSAASITVVMTGTWRPHCKSRSPWGAFHSSAAGTGTRTATPSAMVVTAA